MSVKLGQHAQLDLNFQIGHSITSFNRMKTSKEQTLPENKNQKRDYVKPEIKKREQIKEVTEQGPGPVTVAID
jgi:hypothetical protein